MTSAFDAEVIFFCTRKGANTMASNKHNHFCLIDKFFQINSHQIQKIFLNNKGKNSAVYIKIFQIQKCFQYHLENWQQLTDTDLYQHTLHSSKRNLKQNPVVIYQKHNFQQTQHENVSFSFADIDFSYENQIGKKSDRNIRYRLTQSYTFHRFNQSICPHIERAPPL